MDVRRVKHPEKLGSHLAEPDRLDLSLVTGFDGWEQDLLRLHESCAVHLSGHWELIVIDNPVDEAASERIAALDCVTHVPLARPMGFGASRNLGLRRATGRLVALVDTSIELTGDILAPLEQALVPGIGLVGAYGVVSADGFEFVEVGAGDVLGVEAYLMATRRRLLDQTGLLDPKFRWYRNADLDFSFQIRATGLRTVVTALPVRRHTHRLWETTAESERDEASRKNFWRFRDHWGERTELWTTHHPGGS